MDRPCWTLNEAADGVGEFPQHQEMTPGYEYDAPNSVYKLPFDDLPDFEPNFDTVIISRNSVLTDLISSSPIRNVGLLISSRFRSVLESFELPRHRFFELPLIHRRREVHGYWWLQLPHPKIVIPPDASQSRAEEIISSDPNIATVDLLRLYRPSRFAYCFVSGRLRKSIDEARITGIRFGTAKIFGRV
jgi:hypothetical protein